MEIPKFESNSQENYFSEFRLLRELPDGTRILRLPARLQVPLSGIGGRCECSYCKANPDKVPAWDALAVPSLHAKSTYNDPSCWTVHCPDGETTPRMFLTESL